MTTEQKEAIDRLNFHKDFAQIPNNCAIVNVEEIETVLNLLQEQEAELQKKDKIIDLIAKAFKQDDVRSVEEIKRFYERKVKDEN